MREHNQSRFSDYKSISPGNPNWLVYAPLIRDLEWAISKYASGKLLDIGCGNKPYEKAFLNKVISYTGCDVVQSDLNKVDIICEATKIPLAENSFDTIFSTQVIEHVANHQGLLSEAYRLLRPGGYMILSGPMYWPIHEEPYDFFRFTKYGLEHLLTNAGFTIEKIIPGGGIWSVAAQAKVHALSNTESKFFLIRLWRFFFFKLRIYRIHNAFYRWLDKKDFNPVSTLNYVAVARK